MREPVNAVEAVSPALTHSLDSRVLVAMLDSIALPVALRDADGHTLFANAAGLAHGLANPDPAELALDRRVLEAGQTAASSPSPVTGEEAGERWVSMERHPLVLGASTEVVMVVEYDVTAEVRATESERLSRSRVDFVADMSHELRTPLNSIMGFSQLLLERDGAGLDQRQRRYLENVRISSGQLLDLVNDALDVAKVDAGRLETWVEPLEIASLVDDAVAMMAPLADQKNITLTAHVETESHVLADRRRLLQALLNLLSNAIKFTPSQGLVTIAGSRSMSCYELSVSDTGPGIPAAEGERVFEEFAQLERDRSRPEGTGLGLALARKLVRLMGGEVELAGSQAGVGSVFVIRLRLPDAQLTAH
jgi:signal transduction histidine kinase